MCKRTASAMLVCAASIALPCFAQNQATFNIKTTSTSDNYFSHVYSVDLNNDGKPDLVGEKGAALAGFGVYLSNGDGTFKPGYAYQFPTQYQGGSPIAYGDFNGDGKIDLIAELAGSNQIAFFAGNGDGTFQSPVYETIGLPSGQVFGGEEMLVADFTGDGKIDVITVASAPLLNNIVLIPGQGTGHFGTAKVVYTPPADHGAGWSLRLGDFDADGKADFAFTESSNCSSGGCAAGTVHVEYGDGTGNFTDTTSYSSSGYVFQFNTGDLNNDGKTDIFGLTEGGGTPQLITLYGSSSRTFALHTMSSGLASTSSGLGIPVIADFNGDGAADIAALGLDGGQNAITLFLGDNTPGTFSVETLHPSIGAGQQQVAFVAGDFNRNTKPDVAWVAQSTNAGGGPITLVSELNTTSGSFTSGCSYPAKGQGINACTLTGSSTSVTFHATAASFGKMRKLELWVDGNKIGEQRHDWGDHYNFFNLNTTLAAGSHKATYYAADVDNRLQRTDFSFSVGSSSTCSAPSSAGVHVCKPANGSTVSSPVAVQAAATITGTLARMEVWVDGVKKYTETTSKSFSTSIALGTGKHRFDVYAVNTAGTKWESTVYATVN